jgi:hypothetical protein
MMIELSHSGDFSKTTSYLERIKEVAHLGILNKYGKMGVDALSSATPVDTGKTSKSWSYKIEHDKTSFTLSFYNSNVNNGVPIAVILQYGHGTRNGGYVVGRDYINPAIQPVFDELVAELTKEVSKV